MFFRILLWALLIFFLVRFLWRVIAPLFQTDPQSGENRDRVRGDPQEQKPAGYRDVQDAKFQDLPREGHDGDNRKTGS